MDDGIGFIDEILIYWLLIDSLRGPDSIRGDITTHLLPPTCVCVVGMLAMTSGIVIIITVLGM